MKKTIALIWASYFAFAAAFASISAYSYGFSNNTYLAVSKSQDTATIYKDNAGAKLQKPFSASFGKVDKEDSKTLSVAESKKNTAISKKSSTSNVVLSRGGNSIPSKTKDTYKSSSASKEADSSIKSTSSQNSSKTKTELLDWRSKARYVFSRGASATVLDVYSGKTFRVVRTMGTNHADTETATKKDTQIIKSIWGGFSWTRRPVIVLINGRRLAASMSAMPHAGLDSAAAYVTVNNRSGGYGRGQNLDVIKNNEMNGHFDIHFLNSTRHKDGQADPQHQAAIKIAAKR